MTQYMLSVHHDGVDDAAFQMSDEDMQAAFKAVDAVNAEMHGDRRLGVRRRASRCPTAPPWCEPTRATR